MTEHTLDRLAEAVQRHQEAAAALHDDNAFLRGLVLLLALELDEAEKLVLAAKAVMAHERPQTPAGRAALQHYHKTEGALRTPQELVEQLPEPVREVMREFTRQR